MSYAQLLKQECHYEPIHALASSNKTVPSSQIQPTNQPIETLKQSLQQFTSEVLRKVLARSDSMNLLRQIIDVKAKKVKQKNYETQIFLTILEKEQQRVV